VSDHVLVTAVMVMRVLVDIEDRLSRSRILLGKSGGSHAGKDTAEESAP
jgi:hypothetical protein